MHLKCYNIANYKLVYINHYGRCKIVKVAPFPQSVMLVQQTSTLACFLNKDQNINIIRKAKSTTKIQYPKNNNIITWFLTSDQFWSIRRRRSWNSRFWLNLFLSCATHQNVCSLSKLLIRSVLSKDFNKIL